MHVTVLTVDPILKRQVEFPIQCTCHTCDVDRCGLKGNHPQGSEELGLS